MRSINSDRASARDATGAVRVSVLVPVLNEAPLLRDAVGAMLEQTYPEPIEFILIDGGSTDGSREVIAELAKRDDRIRLVDNPDGTTPRALNRGLQAAHGEFVVRMDAHTRYRPDYIAEGVARLRRGDVVSVSGPQLAVGYDRWSRRVALALGSPLGAGGARFRRAIDDEVDVDSGYTGLWHRAVLLAAGGWEDASVADEDSELAARLRKAGGTIVCIPQLAAEYAPRNSLSGLARQYWSYGRARVRTSRRHPESLRPSQILPSALAVTLVLTCGGSRRLARAARVGTSLYITAVVVESARAAQSGAAPADAVAMPAVFATMHLAFGFGALAGAAEHGIPFAALRHVGRTLAARARRSSGH